MGSCVSKSKTPKPALPALSDIEGRSTRGSTGSSEQTPPPVPRRTPSTYEIRPEGNSSTLDRPKAATSSRSPSSASGSAISSKYRIHHSFGSHDVTKPHDELHTKVPVHNIPLHVDPAAPIELGQTQSQGNLEQDYVEPMPSHNAPISPRIVNPKASLSDDHKKHIITEYSHKHIPLNKVVDRPKIEEPCMIDPLGYVNGAEARKEYIDMKLKQNLRQNSSPTLQSKEPKPRPRIIEHMPESPRSKYSVRTLEKKPMPVPRESLASTGNMDTHSEKYGYDSQSSLNGRSGPLSPGTPPKIQMRTTTSGRSTPNGVDRSSSNISGSSAHSDSSSHSVPQKPFNLNMTIPVTKHSSDNVPSINPRGVPGYTPMTDLDKQSQVNGTRGTLSDLLALASGVKLDEEVITRPGGKDLGYLKILPSLDSSSQSEEAGYYNNKAARKKGSPEVFGYMNMMSQKNGHDSGLESETIDELDAYT